MRVVFRRAGGNKSFVGHKQRRARGDFFSSELRV